MTTKVRCIATAVILALLGAVTIAGEGADKGKSLKGKAFSVKAKFLGSVSSKEEKLDPAATHATAALAVINCRSNRVIRAYQVNGGLFVTLQTPIPQTCAGDSDAQIEECAADGKYIPLGNLPAGTPITVVVMMTDSSGNGAYLQKIIDNDTLDTGVLNVVALVNPGP